MAGDLETRIIISAQDDASAKFKAVADSAMNLAVGAESSSARFTRSLDGIKKAISVLDQGDYGSALRSALKQNSYALDGFAQQADQAFARIEQQARLRSAGVASSLKQLGVTPLGDITGQMKSLGQAFQFASQSGAAPGELALARSSIQARMKELTQQYMNVRAGIGPAPDPEQKGQSWLSGLMSSGVARVGAMAGGMLSAGLLFDKAKDYISDVSTLGARYDTLGVAMHTVGENAGYSKNQTDQAVKSLQESGISALEARQSVAKLVTAHIDLSKATQLGRLAQDAAAVSGLNSSETYNTLIEGIQSAREETLRAIGINVSFEDSYRKMAIRLNTTAEALTETQKMQARLNEVLEYAPRVAGAYEASMDTVGKQMRSMERYTEDFKVALGAAFQPVLAEHIKSHAEALKELTAALKDPGSKQALTDMVSGFVSVLEVLGKIAASPVFLAWKTGEFFGASIARIQAKRDMGEDILPSGPYRESDEEVRQRYLESQAQRERQRRDWLNTNGTPKSGKLVGEGAEIDLSKLAANQDYERKVEYRQDLLGYLNSNRQYQSQDKQLERATKIWEGERGKYQTDWLKASHAGDVQGMKDAEDALAISDQKLIETRKQINHLFGEGAEDAKKYLESLRDQNKALSAQLSGDNLATALAKNNKDFDKAVADVREKIRNAKPGSDVAGYNEALGELTANKALQDRLTTQQYYSKDVAARSAFATSMSGFGAMDPWEARKQSAYSTAVQERIAAGDDQEKQSRAQLKMEADIASIERDRALALANSRKELAGLTGDVKAELSAETDVLNVQLSQAKTESERAVIRQKIANLPLQYYSKDVQAGSAFATSMSGFGAMDPWEARKQAAYSTAVQERVAAGSDQEKQSRAQLKMEADVAAIERDRALALANSRKELAGLTGDVKAELSAEIDVLNIQLLQAKTESERAVILQKVAQLSARRDLDVSGLVNTGLQQYAGRSYNEFADSIQNGIPNAFNIATEAADKFFADAVKGTVNFKAAWTDLKGNMAHMFIDVAMNGVKASLGQVMSSAIPKPQGGDGATLAKSAVSALTTASQPVQEAYLPEEQMATGTRRSSGTSGPLWQRNNNPGNLRNPGGSGFQTFDNLEDGTRAMSDLLTSYGRKGFDSVDKIISRYAPPSDHNDTQGYIRKVSAGMGVSPDQSLDLSNPDVRVALMRPMIRMETGRDAVSDDVLRQAVYTRGSVEKTPNISSTGLGGPDASQSLMSAVRSYGATGIIAGTLGARSLISQFPTNSGVIGYLTGQTDVLETNAGTFGQGPSIFASMAGGGQTGDTFALSAGGSSFSADPESQVSRYVAMGMPYSDAIMQVQAGSGGTTSSGVAESAGASSGGMLDQLEQSALGQGTKSIWNSLTGNNNGGGFLSNLTGSVDNWGYSDLGIGSLSNAAYSGLSSSDVLITTASGQTIAVPSSDVASTLAWNTGSSVSGSAADLAGTSGASVSGGLASSVTSGLAGAGLGFTLGSSIWSNGTGNAGAAIGGGAGAVLGSVIPGVGTFIGGLVGGIAGGGLTGGSTTQTTPTGTNGNTILNVQGLTGYSPTVGFEGFRQTTSGAFGSTSTSHFTDPTIADPVLAGEWRTAMAQQTTGLSSSLYGLGLGTQSLDNFNFPMQFNITSSNYSQAAANVANAMATQAISASKLSDAFNAALEPGEDYIQEIQRIGSAYAATNVAAQAAGTSLANLSGATDQVSQGNWASQAGQLLGSNQAVSSTFGLMQKYGETQPTAMDNTMTALGTQAGQAIGQIGNPNVTVGNFWGQMSTAMQSPMDVTTFQAWSNAATAVQQYDDAQRQSAQLMTAINNQQIAQLQEQLQAVQSVKVMVDGLDQSVQSAYTSFQGLNQSLISTLQGIEWSNTLSPNTPTQTYQQVSAYYNQMKAQVQGEDPSSVSYSSDLNLLMGAGQQLLTTSKSYYGNSAQYYADYNDVTSTLQQLQTGTQSQVDLLKQQLQAQDKVVNAANAQITQLNLVNTNLALLGSSLDGLGTDISQGLASLGAQMSWTPNTQAAVDAANQEEAAVLNALGYQGGFAAGGGFGPGSLLVGERGPEFIRTSLYGSVTSNSDLSSMFDTTHLHHALMQQNGILSYGFSKMHDYMEENNKYARGMHRMMQSNAFLPPRARQ
jgi:phage host-nuclease inhibitor protein Gam